MKILAFTDMHGSLKAYQNIINQAKKSELLLCCGDLTVFQQNLGYFLHKLNQLKKPCLVIPGNHENEKDMALVCRLFENIIYIHKRIELLDHYAFLGHGGGGFSMADKGFERAARLWEKKIKKLRDRDSKLKIIFVCHMPPYKTRVDRIMDAHCGNKSYRKFIDRCKPDYVFCGHLHENNGKKDKIGNVKIINPGPFGKLVSI